MKKDKTILGEFVIGGKRGNKNLHEDHILQSMYLITDMYDKLVFYYTLNNNNNSNNDNNDNNVKYTIINGIKFNDKIIFGKIHDDDNITKFSETIYINSKKPYFDSIKIQNKIMPHIENTNLSQNTEYSQFINFIEIIYNDEIISIGEEGVPGPINNNSYYLETEKVDKACIISGVGLSNYGIFCLQIIEAIEGKFDSNAIDNFTYGRGDIGFVESKIDTNTFKTDFTKKIFIDTFDLSKTDYFHIDIPTPNDMYNSKVKSELQKLNLETRLKLSIEKFIMDYQLIGLEDAETLSVLTYVFSQIAYWSPNEDGLHRYYPMFLSLLDRAMVDRDFKVIHTVKRLHRMLNHLIYLKEEDKDELDIKKTIGIYIPEKKLTLFNISKPLLIKLNKIWKCFSKIANKAQRVHQSQISLNAYQVALLSGKNYRFSIITIMCQICLISLIGINFNNTKMKNIFPLLEGKIIIPVIFIFSCIMAWKQITNTWDFRCIFPDLRFYFNGFLDVFSNYICAITVVIFNFFLLSFNNSLIDIVLNSIAALFIIELDDVAVFLSNDSIMDLFKQKLIDEMFNKFSKIPSIYFNNPINKNDTWLYINSINNKGHGRFILEGDEDKESDDSFNEFGNNSRIYALNTKFYKINKHMEIVSKFELKFNKNTKLSISEPFMPLKIISTNSNMQNMSNMSNISNITHNIEIDYGDAIFV